MHRLLGLAAFAVFLGTVPAAPAWAELRLAMFQQAGCAYCRQWDREIAEIYPKTSEGRAAPLMRLDIRAPLPDGITLDRKPQFTPTFVLLDDGHEIGRIEGYPGEDFFWGLLGGLLP
ncbi:MAG: hypothetical protein KDA73_12900 [Rhodobacteraceae bacterium]|nr:hypothetical protein [Paracoccaceae bacterium]